MVRDTIILRAPHFAEGPVAPLLQRAEPDDFLEAVFDELRTPEGRTRLRQSQVQERISLSTRRGRGRNAAAAPVDSCLRLYRPVHRVFHVVLFEAFCDRPGSPPLDPARIDSAGLVIRRLLPPRSAQGGMGAGHAGYAGWMTASETARGWSPLGSAAADHDPDPARRRPLLRTGNAEIDRRLAAMARSGPALAESVVSLFPVPPAVCRAAGRTLLVGVLPTGSMEESEAPPDNAVYSADEIAARIPTWLAATPGGRRVQPPRAGQLLGRDQASDPALADFIDMLGKVVVGWGLLDDTPGARALRQALDRLDVEDADNRTRKLGDTIEQAARVLLHGDAGSFRMPLRWAAITAQSASAIAAAVHAAANQQLAAVRPRETRFEDEATVYRARAFVRVDQHGAGADGDGAGAGEDCPPALVWSEYTEAFQIAAWWRNGPGRPTLIALPDPTPQNLRELKPNVAFKLSPGLFDLLRRNTPGDFLDGKATAGVGIGLQWICGFNIPIITLCAFIVLFIFLVLLNIVFWWLPFVRVCIPLPAPKEE